MLSYVHGTGSVPLLGETIGAALDRAAAQFGSRDALVSCHQNLRYTYDDLLREVNQVARALLVLGVERGDRVGIWSGNTAQWLIVQYAAAKAGAILVNVNPSYRLRELEYALNQSGIRVLVTARSFRKTDYVELLTTLMPELTRPRHGPLETEKVPALEHLIYLDSNAAPGGMAWADFVRLGDRVPAQDLSARKGSCNSTTRPTFSTRRAPPDRRREPRSRITTF
jgi:fatty-acyl-CoA synthase